MKHVLLLLTVGALLCAAGSAGAGGRMALYADAGGTDCGIEDGAPGVVQIHMIYEGDQGAAAVAFAAPTPACWTGAVWVGDIIDAGWLAGLGDTHDLQKGTLVNLLGCYTGPVHLGLMSFVTQGKGQKCCRYEIIGSVNEGGPGVLDCATTFVAIETGPALINPKGSCRCGDDNALVAVDESTWGRVKSLYR